MRKYLYEFRSENKPERLISLLFNWRIWLIGGILGSLLGFAFYQLFPPNYRAEAYVVVDQNAEEAYPYLHGDGLFSLLHREQNKLEAFAYSNKVIRTLEASYPDYDRDELEDEILDLVITTDGVWYFYAEHDDPDVASGILGIWVQAFLDRSAAAINVSAELELKREELEIFLLENPTPSNAELKVYLDEIKELQQRTMGISQYVDLVPNQIIDEDPGRAVEQGVYILSGAVLLIILIFLVFHFVPYKTKGQDV